MTNRRMMQHLPSYYEGIADMEQLAATETVELDLLQQALDQMYADQYVQTSGIQAIRRRERMLGIQADPTVETLAFRRRRILNRYQTKPPFTVRYLQQQLDALVGEGMTYVAVDVQAFVLTVTAEVDNAQVFAEVLRTIETIKPANLIYQQNTALSDRIELQEALHMREMTWQYTLDGQWQLGEQPFVTYGTEVPIT